MIRYSPRIFGTDRMKQASRSQYGKSLSGPIADY
jgi:hypothetical protein